MRFPRARFGRLGHAVGASGPFTKHFDATAAVAADRLGRVRCGWVG